LNRETVNELKNIAKHHGYASLLQLVNSITA
jgi:hypothetical protein